MTESQAMSSGGVDSPELTGEIHLRVGALDYAGVSRLRKILSDCATGPDVHLQVDLSQADPVHDMTLFALLGETAGPLLAAGGVTTVLGPSARLTHLLVAIGVSVSSIPIPYVARGAHHLSVGAVADTRSPRPSCVTCA